MRKIYVFFIVGLIMCALNVDSRANSKVLAEVDDFKITEDYLQNVLDSIPDDRRPNISRDVLINKLIERELFYKAASKEGMDKKEEFINKMDLLKKDILVTVYVDYIKENIKVSEKEIKDVYLEKYKPTLQMKASHILFSKEQKKDAEKYLDEIKKDESLFSKVAEEKSICPSGKQGGSLGWFGLGSMVKEFEDAVLKMKVGEIAGLVETNFGYHIIKLEDKKEDKKSLDEVRDTIAEEIKYSKLEGVVKDKLNSLKKEYEVIKY